MKEDGTEVLDIFVLSKGNSLRVSLPKNDIFEFCKTNKIPKKSIKKMILKKPLEELKKIQNKDYNFSVNIKNEIEYTKLSEELQVENEIYKEQFTNNEFNLVNKRFRFKKRYSFVSKNKLFQIDLTIVKQSEGKNFISSDVINNNNNRYEIEIEYIGPSKKKI